MRTKPRNQPLPQLIFPHFMFPHAKTDLCFLHKLELEVTTKKDCRERNNDFFLFQTFCQLSGALESGT